MKGLKLIFWVVVLLILLSLAWQNIPPLLNTEITLGYKVWKIGAWETEPIPLYAVIIISFLAGLALMWLIDFSTRMRMRRKVRGLEKELRNVRSQTGYDTSTSLASYSDEPLDEDRELMESGEPRSN